MTSLIQRTTKRYACAVPHRCATAFCRNQQSATISNVWRPIDEVPLDSARNLPAFCPSSLQVCFLQAGLQIQDNMHLAQLAEGVTLSVKVVDPNPTDVSFRAARLQRVVTPDTIGGHRPRQSTADLCGRAHACRVSCDGRAAAAVFRFRRAWRCRAGTMGRRWVTAVSFTRTDLAEL